MKIALDWDDEQVRMVAADRSARGIRIRAAAVAPIGEDGLQATLTELTRQYSLEKSDALVAVGRDRAELRQMRFPPVPTDELPDMVRFQAIRQFASAGDSATIDFITTHTDDEGIDAIVAATGPAHLTPIRQAIEGAGWTLERVGLRPIAAAALYRLQVPEATSRASQTNGGDEPIVALIDLVANEAEIVLLNQGEIKFVRSVRLPDGDAATSTSRSASLAGEIRRSLIACGAAGSNCDVVMWGREARHGEELKLLAERLSGQQDVPCQTRLLDPLELVGADAKIRQGTGEMVGRLAPLVGMLVADAGHEQELVDFLHPRKAVEAKTDTAKIAMMVGIPAVLVLTIGWLLWSNLARLDAQIAQQTAANNDLRKKTEVSDTMIERTEQIDQFLDSDVNWLDELEHLADAMPPSDELIVKDIVAAANPRGGGGKIVVTGLVTSPDVIKEFETTMRDKWHQVTGDKVTQLASDDAYRWQMSQTIELAPEAVREKRYARMLALNEPAATPETDVAPRADEDPATGGEPAPESGSAPEAESPAPMEPAALSESAPTPPSTPNPPSTPTTESTPTTDSSDATEPPPASDPPVDPTSSDGTPSDSETTSDSQFVSEATQ
ncbi:type IV pilus biogenesis protein PilM [Allorhodopirellula solitaria]|uniref:Competence protein A n=1 Tax=Allorhodopirellula solitaria TaxID=2527987 RepID=A0A5C5XV55_9BACT|nr:hypothetical protein [Allorhodopirellula solitaria]TWT66379.1 hypothetical protein CA85_24730 [Allorhodopirellula solitaria]